MARTWTTCIAFAGLLGLARTRYLSYSASSQHVNFDWNGSDRVIVVGDVHGCLKELMQLLDKVEFQAGDKLFFVGDLVRKGPDSKGVVELARKLNARTVKGNHDFYAVTEKETKKLNLNPDDVEYLKNAPLSITIDKLNTIIVHAGMLPTGGPQALDPMMLMTMRNVVNNKPSINSDEGVPWVSIYRGPRHVIFGHDAKRGLQLADFATGLDTGCVYGKALTALILPERKFVSVQSSMPIPNRHEE